MDEGAVSKHVVFAVVALLVGLAGGYYYGYSSGRTNLLAEQVTAMEEAAEGAQEEIADAANPFGGARVNPFEGGYENPFEGAGGGVNPFAE